MKSFFEVIGNIRDIINSQLSQPDLLSDKQNWNKLCSSLDTIEDTQHAIDKYQDLDGFERHEGYLLLYGLVQAIYLQQDSINSLSKSLIKKEVKFSEEYPRLYRIREIRNDSIGHPTNRRNDKYHVVINQGTIRKSGFQYIIYDADSKPKFEYVNLDEIINTQKELSIEILVKIFSAMEKEIKSHISNFSKSKLSDYISTNIDYFFQKLYQGCHSESEPASYTKVNILYLKDDIFEKIVSGVEERYKTLDAIMGFKNQVEKIRYIFDRLLTLLEQGKYSKGFESETLIDSLKYEFEELKDLIQDIDEEFNTE